MFFQEETTNILKSKYFKIQNSSFYKQNTFKEGYYKRYKK